MRKIAPKQTHTYVLMEKEQTRFSPNKAKEKDFH